MGRTELEALFETLLMGEDSGGRVADEDDNFSEFVFNYSQLDLSNFTNYRSQKGINFERNFAILLSTIGILTNVMSLSAMLHISGSFSSNQKLVLSLLLSDLFVSFALLLMVLNDAISPFFTMGEDYERKICVFTVIRALVMTGHTISLFNLVFLAFDHFLAINMPLKYMHFFSGKKVTLTLAGMWLLAALCGFSDFLFPGPYYLYCENRELVNFCEVGYCSKYETEYLLFPLIHVCFVVMVVFYSRVFLKIYKYQKMAGRHQRHMKRNIKGLITTLIILGTFLLCWLPHCIFEAYFLIKTFTDHLGTMKLFQTFIKVDYYLYSLWLVNSICDPIIYAIRMREVKNGYQKMLRCRVVTDLYNKARGKQTQETYLSRRSATASTACEFTETNLNTVDTAWN